MKFLENSKLESLGSLLSVETAQYRLDTRIESYSCKKVAKDKRLFKGFLQAEGPGSKATDLQALSPPVYERTWTFPNSCSPSNNSDQETDNDADTILCDAVSAETLFNMIAALNISFPDYDFTGTKGENFSKLPSLDDAIFCVDSRLSTVVDNYSNIKHQIWAVLNEEIQLKECEIYSYHPDYQSDPYSEDGCTWSFNYFFYSKRLKRVLFFTGRCLSLHASTASTLPARDDCSLEWEMD